MASPLDLLRKIGIYKQTKSVTTDVVRNNLSLTDQEKNTLRKFRLTSSELSSLIQQTTRISYERANFYRDADQAQLHPIIGAALELYSEYSTTFNSLQNSTVWITSEDSKVRNELEAFLDRIGIEEKIFDWAYNTGLYGDLFLKLHAEPGAGIIWIDDSHHPADISRIDLKGRLIGFYETPQGMISPATTTQANLVNPWSIIHLRLLGAKKKRALYGDPNYTEYTTTSLMNRDTRQLSSKYGSSLLSNAMPVYKRLRLAEDSLLIGRLSKGLRREIFKVMVDGANHEAVNEILDDYTELLKRGNSLDLTNNKFGSIFEALTIAESIILPVWGDVNNVQVDEIGGDMDIKWITDVEELRNQLATALRIPLQLLGGYTGEMPSGLGTSALERLDIRFARSARRLQRSLIDGITRMCQVNLAYIGMDPDVEQFEVNMSETSTAEEEELKDALDKGVDVVVKVSEMIQNVVGEGYEIEKLELLNYLNDKILKLGDLQLNDLIRKVEQETSEEQEIKVKEEVPEEEVPKESRSFRRTPLINDDTNSFLPVIEGSRGEEKWRELYENVKITIEKSKERGKG